MIRLQSHVKTDVMLGASLLQSISARHSRPIGATRFLCRKTAAGRLDSSRAPDNHHSLSVANDLTSHAGTL